MKPTIRKFGHRWVLTVPMVSGQVAFERPSWEACVKLLRRRSETVHYFAGYEHYKRMFMRTEAGR